MGGEQTKLLCLENVNRLSELRRDFRKLPAQGQYKKTNNGCPAGSVSGP